MSIGADVTRHRVRRNHRCIVLLSLSPSWLLLLLLWLLWLWLLQLLRLVIITCHGKLPNPASSPPTILRCAPCCLATEMPQPTDNTYKFCLLDNVKHRDIVFFTRWLFRSSTTRGLRHVAFAWSFDFRLKIRYIRNLRFNGTLYF